ncbi:MAG: type I restriction-modification system subunit M [Planctomycetaceae bacterium]|jgi:type I restriction enzyme M protein|nr:type I restriction-modification system subunit M [Planctomycetaceae bacterium]
MTKEEINNIIWGACDTFRGVMDASDYKNYILTLLFIKFLSDLFDERFAQLQAKYGKDSIRLERAVARERFLLPKVELKDKSKVVDTFPAHFRSLYERREKPNIGELINIVLAHIENTNSGKLENVFRNIDFNSEKELGDPKERNRRLKSLLGDFDKLDLKPSHLENQDVIGDAYEFLIEKFAAGAGKKAGEFYTPPEVSKLLAQLIRPESGHTICDPACGSGSLLIRVAKVIGTENYALFGQESNGSTWSLCKMNMFLHNADNARIEWCNTLSDPRLLEHDELMRFDRVVANPPFSLDKWGAENAVDDRFRRFHRGVPPKSRGDFAFISHMIEIAKPGSGRVAVIVPHGVLFRAASEGKIRQSLIDENLLDAVIGLPANLFFGTGIPAAILIFDKGRKKTDVLFIDASQEFENNTNKNKLRLQDVEKIIKTYNSYKTIERYAYRATRKEIEQNDYNLNIPRYVNTFEEEEEINIAEIQQEIDTLESELIATKKKIKHYLKELEIS